MDKLVITPSGLIDLLSQLDALAGLDIGITDSDEGIYLLVGDNTYLIKSEDASSVEVEPTVLDQVDEVDEEGYEDIEYVDTDETPVTAGILKEAIKTLLIGGLVRLTKKLLTK